MSTPDTPSQPPNTPLAQALEQHEHTKKLLLRVLTRLTIAASGLSPQLDPLLTQLLSLLRKKQGMTQAIQCELERVSEALFQTAMSGLEGRKKHGATAIPQEEDAEIAPSQEAHAQHSAAPLELLFGFLKSRLTEARQVAALNDLQTRLQKENDLTETVIFTEIERCLADLLNAEPSESSRASGGILARLFAKVNKRRAGRLDLEPLRKNLLALLDAMDVPQPLQSKANHLRAKLERALELEALLEVFEETVAFFAKIKLNIQREGKYLEDFLNELTHKLAELERQTLGVHELTLAAEAEAAEMRATFQDHVDHLRLSAHSATDLEALKAALHQRLEVISAYLNAEREEERERHRRTEEQVRQLTKRLQEMEEETERLRSKLRMQHNLALRDPLTGLPNRLAYEERIQQELLRLKRFATPFSLLIWDVDHFKSINDRFGHKAGDKALMAIAEILVTSIRETDFVGRFGGEEFVMILAGTEGEDALKVAESIRAKVANCGFNSHGKPVAITISCGITSFRPNDTPDQAFERADEALYRAKRAGRNCCILAD